MNSKGCCGTCKTGTPGNGQLTEIGESVTLSTWVGRGHDDTTYNFFQCQACGSVWTQYEDSGAGGHGRFWKRLTEGHF